MGLRQLSRAPNRVELEATGKDPVLSSPSWTTSIWEIGVELLEHLLKLVLAAEVDRVDLLRVDLLAGLRLLLLLRDGGLVRRHAHNRLRVGPVLVGHVHIAGDHVRQAHLIGQVDLRDD
jgi:hypothetical protein